MESFVFLDLSHNHRMNNLSMLKSSFFLSVFIICFVVGITGGSMKF